MTHLSQAGVDQGLKAANDHCRRYMPLNCASDMYTGSLTSPVGWIGGIHHSMSNLRPRTAFPRREQSGARLRFRARARAHISRHEIHAILLRGVAARKQSLDHILLLYGGSIRCD